MKNLLSTSANLAASVKKRGVGTYADITLRDPYSSASWANAFLFLFGDPGPVLIDWGDGTEEVIEITNVTFENEAWVGHDYYINTGSLETGNLIVSTPGYVTHTYSGSAAERKIRITRLTDGRFSVTNAQAIIALCSSWELDYGVIENPSPAFLGYVNSLATLADEYTYGGKLVPVDAVCSPGFSWYNLDFIFAKEQYALEGLSHATSLLAALGEYSPSDLSVAKSLFSYSGSDAVNGPEFELLFQSAAITNWDHHFAGWSSASFPLIDLSSGTSFNQTWRQSSNLTSFPLLDMSSGTDFTRTWYSCTSLISFPPLDLSSGTNFNNTWGQCINLTSFPLLNVSSGTNFAGAWAGCNDLTSFPLLDISSGTNFNGAWAGCGSLTSFPLLNVSSGTNFAGAWAGCGGLTSFPLLDLSAGIDFGSAWSGCDSLISFPLLDISSGIYFQNAWQNCASLTSFPPLDFTNALSLFGTWWECVGLTSFPLINTSNVQTFTRAWYNCTGLTSFPSINVSSGEGFGGTWRGCSGLTSFPLLNVSSATNFADTWQDCTSLTSFPANFFNGCQATNLNAAFLNCALNQTSVNNILISINSNGTSGGTLSINGGTSAAPSGAGLTAKNALISRGWIVVTN